MKYKTIIAAALAVGFTSSAMAQTTEITITGATAFRQATMQAIYNAYASVGNLGASFNVCHDFSGNNLSQLIASNKAVFSGRFPGITGTTVVRTSFNGSTEGLNAIAGNNNPTFLQTAALGSPGAVIKGSTTAPTETLRPKFSFSDVYQSSSPVDNEVLNPVGESAVGVVTFTMIANKGTSSSLKNVTVQQARALWENGIQPLSLFTGRDADRNRRVLATGRNDGSGTRAAYLTEWGYGLANPVKQYIATATGTTGTDITTVTLVPANGAGTGIFATGSANNASTLWGITEVGNGGYSSGSALRTFMGLESKSVTVYDGVKNKPVLRDSEVSFITWLSTADARNAASKGGRLLAYNGVSVKPLGPDEIGNYQNKGFSKADFDKIARGAYSPWSFQHLYYSGSLGEEETVWYNSMKSTWLPQSLQQTANGLTLQDMRVTREDDGFPIVAPL
jgi:hypothetical protein